MRAIGKEEENGILRFHKSAGFAVEKYSIITQASVRKLQQIAMDTPTTNSQENFNFLSGMATPSAEELESFCEFVLANDIPVDIESLDQLPVDLSPTDLAPPDPIAPLNFNLLPGLVHSGSLFPDMQLYPDMSLFNIPLFDAEMPNILPPPARSPDHDHVIYTHGTIPLIAVDDIQEAYGMTPVDVAPSQRTHSTRMRPCTSDLDEQNILLGSVGQTTDLESEPTRKRHKGTMEGREGPLSSSEYMDASLNEFEVPYAPDHTYSFPNIISSSPLFGSLKLLESATHCHNDTPLGRYFSEASDDEGVDKNAVELTAMEFRQSTFPDAERPSSPKYLEQADLERCPSDKSSSSAASSVCSAGSDIPLDERRKRKRTTNKALGILESQEIGNDTKTVII
ncbi:Protein of unknown function [Pyronema omphalodes CBS 100304]|uniref:Uncharacterized protein n=1 Tax=Pyronema omphalodes (strain CBS 100304) TaxID=1076935 RepID=U4LVE8_PYROM|nr:Protein of unknown function [Pyronema omphalodes CBS 100304]